MIHLISKDYYLKHKTSGELKKFIIKKNTKFPNIVNQFFLDSHGDCFIYLQELGFVIAPRDSRITEDIILEELDTSCWYIEKYDIPLKMTKNYIYSFPNIDIYNNSPGKEWLQDYQGFIRIWNTLTSEDFIIYKTRPSAIYDKSKSYICKLIPGNEIKFPINIKKANEMNSFIKDVIQWI